MNPTLDPSAKPAAKGAAPELPADPVAAPAADHSPHPGRHLGPEPRSDLGPHSGPDSHADLGPHSGPDSHADLGPHSGPDPRPDLGPLRSSPRVRALLALIIGVYLLYSSFGIAGPFLWGHHGYHGATYAQRARMTLRYHIVTPATWNGYSQAPEPQSFYLHHPIGYHHVLVPFMAVLGESEWVVRGVAVLGGVPLLLALFALVRRFWSAAAGLVACAVYVALPILCSFSVLSDPMLLEMTCCLIAVHAFLRYLQAPTGRLLATGCIALAVGGLLMWETYFQAFFHGLYVLFLLTTSRGRKLRLGRVSALGAWFLGTFLCTSAAMAFHVLFTWKIGMLGDMVSSFKERSSAGWPWVIAQHKLWLTLLYGKPILALGAVWLAVYVVRLLRGRTRARDQAVLLFFLINTLYCLLFRKGSSIHLYRVYFYSAFFALAVTDLIVDLRALVARWASVRVANFSAAAAVAAYFAAVLPHALHNLIESREVMGTHGQPNYNAEYNKLLFARAAAEHTDKAAFAVFYNLPYRLEFTYYFDRSYGVSPWGELFSLAQLDDVRKRHANLVLMTQKQLPPEPDRQLRLLLQKHDAYAYDNFLLVKLDHETEHPELHEYHFVPVRPSWVWRWFYSHKYPPMQAVELSR